MHLRENEYQAMLKCMKETRIEVLLNTDSKMASVHKEMGNRFQNILCA